ncbi:EthD family reductase [Pseudomonas aeruginosa]|uniref:EthD family reductase n=1 Tax=Pseudomonas aeruginosa TaxID=287 RepID=UPI002358B3B0|nr:EthD family reductase [Pseudomonas aeruginosa]MDY1450511.1 EthD family reductase [Pseudomonas aeruginosa]HEJ2935037.1 EthD family reductase [Pseudomonas aeruginosa]
MKRVIVIYGVPEDPVAFNKHYREVHVPLVERMPNLAGFEASIGDVASSDGAACHAVAILSYSTQADLEASLASAEGIAAVEDVAKFATGGCRILTGEFQSF